MTPKEKAKELFLKFNDATFAYDSGDHSAEGINESILLMVKEAKRCAIIAAENEYKEKRELLFLLRANKVIESEKTYWYYIQLMIDEENELKQEIEKL